MPTRRAGEACSAPGWSGTSVGRQPLVATQISTWRLPACCRASRDFGRCLGVLGVPDAQLLEQRGIMLATNRQAPIPEVEARPMPRRVLLRGCERRERADVAPVRRLLVLEEPGHLVLCKVVGVVARLFAEPRQQVAAEIELAARDAFLERALEHARVEEVIAH